MDARFFQMLWIRFGLFIVCAVISPFSPLYAQDSLSVRRTMLDAVKAIDSGSPKDMEWVSAFVEKHLIENPKDSLAHCLMAIVQFRSMSFEQCLESVQQANAGNSPEIIRATVAKFQLLCSINLDDAATSNRLFKALLAAAQRDSTSLQVRKSYCEWLGEIIGTLDRPESNSPIELDSLTKAKRAIVGMPEVALSQAFENRYQIAKNRSDRISEVLKKYEDMGEPAFRAFEKEQSEQLEKLELLLSETNKDKKEMTEANQAQAKGLRTQMAALRDQLRIVDRESATPTPGMPVAVPVPILPRRELIFVEPFQYRIVTEYIDNRRYDRQVQERRPIWDIEAERDLIYQNQMSVYNRQNALYQQYQTSLTEWNRRDAERRKDLSQKKMELEKQMSQIRQELDQLDDARKDFGNNSDLRKAITLLKQELQAIQEVLRAADIGKPYRAIRPNRVDMWLLSEEKNRLLRLVQSQF